ncbi:MAG: hypothetical protein ACSLE2_12785 [Lysobacterales bacterium]
MIIEAGDIGVIVDTGTNAPGVPLQRLEAGEWRDFEQDGEPVRWPVKIDTLPPDATWVACRGGTHPR